MGLKIEVRRYMENKKEKLMILIENNKNIIRF